MQLCLGHLRTSPAAQVMSATLLKADSSGFMRQRRSAGAQRVSETIMLKH
jgi:hypothetical protein